MTFVCQTFWKLLDVNDESDSTQANDRIAKLPSGRSRLYRQSRRRLNQKANAQWKSTADSKNEPFQAVTILIRA